MTILILYFLSINLISFLMMYIDKRRAIRKDWRISEAALIGVSIIGGSIGGYLGMKIFRHKTKHAKFFIGIPTILFIQVALIIYIIFKFSA